MRAPEAFDLDAIKARAAAEDVPLLVAEVERLERAAQALRVLVRLERGRIQRLTRSNPDLLSAAELKLARAWADVVEAVHS